MLKFLQLLKEQEENKPLSKTEHKILKNLHRKFLPIDYVTNDDIDVYNNVSHYLKNTFALNPQQILSLYYLFVNNTEDIGSESDEWTKDPIRGYDRDEHYTGDDEDIIGELLGIPPNFIGDSDHSYYAMDQYFVKTNGNHYAIGTYKQVKDSLIQIVDDMVYGLTKQSPVSEWLNSELYHIHGESYIIEHMFIPEDIQSAIADEEATRMIDEEFYHDDAVELLRQVEYIRPDIGDAWQKLEEKKYELEDALSGNDNDDIIYNKIEEIEKEINILSDQSKEILHEKEYDDALERMKDPVDFLWEHGYIEKEGRGWGFEDRENFPKWVRVDIDKIKKDLNARSIEYRVDDLARADGKEHQVEYKGETYYIYRTE
jgi:hypothetical protein